MGVGHVPEEPVRAEGPSADVQGRQRRGAPGSRSPDLAARARGRWGEDQAARWYARHGAEVVCRNWRCDIGEVDLIVRCGETLVFVEVKARATGYFGSPASAVDHRKQRRLRALAVRWLAEHPHRGPIRFDVVAVTGTAVEVIEAAF